MSTANKFYPVMVVEKKVDTIESMLKWWQEQVNKNGA